MKSKKNKAAQRGQDNPSKRNKHQQPNSPASHPSAPKTTPTKAQSTCSGPPIFFFKDDEQSHGFLCQWYKCQFTDPESGLEFTCTEQWMMWHKAKLAQDTSTAAQIMATTSPRKQKQLGREVVGFDAAAWDEIKSDVVERGNHLKFTQGTNASSMRMDDVGETVPLRELLLATGKRELVEASRFDRVWGIGFDAQQALSTPRDKWGENLLGEALMNVRESIRREL